MASYAASCVAPPLGDYCDSSPISQVQNLLSLLHFAGSRIRSPQENKPDHIFSLETLPPPDTQKSAASPTTAVTNLKDHSDPSTWLGLCQSHPHSLHSGAKALHVTQHYFPCTGKPNRVALTLSNSCISRNTLLPYIPRDRLF